MDVLKDIKEALEEGAEAIEPSEADVRVIAIEEEPTHAVPPGPKRGHGRAKAPASAEVHPSPKEIGREHRGY